MRIHSPRSAFLRRPASLLCLALALGTPLAQAQQPGETPLGNDEGFTQPLEKLRFNPGLNQHEFERATFEALEVYDPWEGFNRRMYHFNYRLDEWVMLPVVHGYEYVTPRVVRTGVSNFFSNLGEVSTLVNSLLQLKGKRAMNATARILFNTTFGVLGLWDPATRMGLPKQSEDFGQTLGHYGLGAGPYLILPVLGPSSLRDAGGRLADFGLEREINFLNYTDVSEDHPELMVLRAVNARYVTNFRYGQLNSPFEYEKVRYVYRRARQLQVEQ